MVRLIFWFAVLVAVTFGVTWLADSPGAVSIDVRGYHIETQSIGLVVLAIVLLFLVIWIGWGILKWLLGRPTAFGGFFARRRDRKGSTKSRNHCFTHVAKRPTGSIAGRPICPATW